MCVSWLTSKCCRLCHPDLKPSMTHPVLVSLYPMWVEIGSSKETVSTFWARAHTHTHTPRRRFRDLYRASCLIHRMPIYYSQRGRKSADNRAKKPKKYYSICLGMQLNKGGYLFSFLSLNITFVCRRNEQLILNSNSR